MKNFFENLPFSELENVSGGKHSEYVAVTDAIFNRLKALGTVEGAYMRLPEGDAADWLEKNIGVKAEFNTKYGFDFLNGAAVYQETAQSKAGSRLTQQEVLDKISKWTPNN